MIKDNYLTNWFKKNISKEVIEVRVEKTELIEVRKPYVCLDFNRLEIIYSDKTLVLNASEWLRIEVKK